VRATLLGVPGLGLFALSLIPLAVRVAPALASSTPLAGVPLASAPLTTSPADHSGTYVLLQQTVTVAEIPILADVLTTMRAISLGRLTHEAGRLRGEASLCQLAMENSSDLVKTELPAAFRRSLPPVRIDAELAPKEDGVVFRQAAQSLVVGARLGAEEELPTRANDPRVFDQDQDDKPGVTVRVSGLVSGDIYLVQRSTTRLFGALRGSAFTGRIDFKVEQSVLGTTNRLIGGGPESRPVPSRSYFRLEKVPSDWTCEQAQRLAAGWR